MSADEAPMALKIAFFGGLISLLCWSFGYALGYDSGEADARCEAQCGDAPWVRDGDQCGCEVTP